jgi:hypothetical protein
VKQLERKIKLPVTALFKRDIKTMDAGYFIIAILGCADGGAACTPVATVPTRYESQSQCKAATADALASRTDLDFPTLLAECRAARAPAAARGPARGLPAPAVLPAALRRG